MLREIQKEFIGLAKTLGVQNDGKKSVPVYEVLSINELADNYCKATDDGDEHARDVYFAALVCRFWFKIDRTYRENSQLGDRTFFYTMLVDSILLALSRRDWQLGKVNAQTCINQTFYTRGLAAAYYESNLDKHKANYNTMSLETPLGNGDGDDAEKTIGDMLEDESSRPDEFDGAACLIQDYINAGKVVEAIFLDTIAYQDCEKKTRVTHKEVDDEGNEYKYTSHSSEFWPYKVVQFISKLPEDYMDYFTDKYVIKTDKLEAVLDTIKKSNNQKLYKFLSHTIETAKDDIKAIYAW